MIVLLGKRKLVALLFIDLWFGSVCLGLFALPLVVIGRLCSVIVAFPGHL